MPLHHSTLSIGAIIAKVRRTTQFPDLNLQHDISHGPQEQTTFREIWIPISHAKHCSRRDRIHCLARPLLYLRTICTIAQQITDQAQPRYKVCGPILSTLSKRTQAIQQSHA